MLSRSAVNHAAAWPVLTDLAPRDNKARADRNIPTGSPEAGRGGSPYIVPSYRDSLHAKLSGL